MGRKTLEIERKHVMSSPDFYNNYWKSGEHNQTGWDRPMFDRVLSCLKGRKKVLDYGCGVGHKYRRFLREVVGEYTGADVSDVAVESVLREGCQAFKIDASTSEISAGSESFDGAVCSEVLEHLFDPLKAAREIFRVLKPGAPFVVTVPNFGYHVWRLYALLRARVPDEPENSQKNPFNGVHIRYFSAWTLKKMLTMAGFEQIKIDSYIRGSIWDVFRIMGPLSRFTVYAHRWLPPFLHLRFLSDWFPGLFAERLRAVCIKPLTVKMI